MIEIQNLNKSFGPIRAVSNLTLNIKSGEVFGLIGTNGAGKSTLMRMISGILLADSGSITMDGLPVYDMPAQKEKLFFIPDEPYFFRNATPEDMKTYYGGVYPTFSAERFDQLIEAFGLDPKRKIRTFSKGMKKQTAIICALASRTQYLLCDETFDGLDPVVRQAVKSLFAEDMEDRRLTPVIASHSLRELEDICDHVGLLHKGGILLSEDLNAMKLGIHKLQCVFTHERDAETAFRDLHLVHEETRGRLHTVILRAGEGEIRTKLADIPMVFCEMLPLTLEEIFICETEVVGYDIKSLILE